MPDLEPIPLPPDANHYIMMPLREYRERETFYKQFEREIQSIDRAIQQGRLEGKLAGYQVVLSHARSPMSPVRSPEVVATLERLIEACELDLKHLLAARDAQDGAPTPAGPEEPAYHLTDKAVRHVELKCPLEPGHDGPCMGEQVVGQATPRPAPAG